jgi:hypothetical protein
MSTVEYPRAEGLLHNPGFSPVVAASGTRTIYTAGQVSIDGHGALVGGDDLAAQTAQAMHNVGLALAEDHDLCRELQARAANRHRHGASTVFRGRDAAGEHPRRGCRARAAGVAG